MLALAVVTADCVPVLMADARAGVIAAVHAGRVGAQNGMVRARCETMVAVGARVEDISVLLGPAVSGRNYEVPAAMAAEVEAALPGSRTTTARGTPGLDLRAGIAGQLTGLGVQAIDVDPRCTVEDRNLFSHRRDAPTGRLASLVWMECPAVTSARELELARRAGRRAEPARPPRPRPPDATSNEIELLPVTKFFPASRRVDSAPSGVPGYSANRANRKRRNKAAEVSDALGRCTAIRWHMVGRIQRNKARAVAGWAYAAHSVDSARVIAALDRGARAEALADGAGPSRCGSTSRSASTVTRHGAAWTSTARAGRRAVRRRRGRAKAWSSSA